MKGVRSNMTVGTIYEYPEGSTSVCRFCHERILLDQREGGGSGKDWGSRPEDWIGNGGKGMDYGCDRNPISNDDGSGGHEPGLAVDMPPVLIKEVDPELERLLKEEEEIEQRAREQARTGQGARQTGPGRSLRVDEGSLTVESEPTSHDTYTRKLTVEVYDPDVEDETVVNIRVQLEPKGKEYKRYSGGMNLTHDEASRLRDFLDAVVLDPGSVERTFNELRDRLRDKGDGMDD